MGMKTKIPLIKPFVGKEELLEVKAVLESGWLSQGEAMRSFEKELGTYLGARHVVSTSSCTTALSLAIEALRLKPRSEVIVPDFTHPATANVVSRAGLAPVIADVRLDTYGISVDALKRSITSRTSAIIAVHPFGHPFELDEVRELASGRGLELIEDAATAIGTKYKGNLIGKSGRAVCFSFHPRKLLTTGEGGCLATDDDGVAELARAMRSHGEVKDASGSHFVYNGLNYRLSDVNAALGLAQLRKIGALMTRRRKMAKVYKDGIVADRIRATPPIEEAYGYHTYQSYVVRLDNSADRDRCKSRLKEEFGIETQVGTYSLHMQPAFAKCRGSALENGSRLYRSTLTLPLYHTLSDVDQTFVISALGKVVGRDPGSN